MRKICLLWNTIIVNIVYTTLLSSIYWLYTQKNFSNLNFDFVIKYRYLAIVQFYIRYILSLYLIYIKFN